MMAGRQGPSPYSRSEHLYWPGEAAPPNPLCPLLGRLSIAITFGIGWSGSVWHADRGHIQSCLKTPSDTADGDALVHVTGHPRPRTNVLGYIRRVDASKGSCDATRVRAAGNISATR